MLLQKLIYSTLAVSLTVGIQLPGQCDTTRTTVETTTVTTTPSTVDLPVTGTYIVVDPVSGIVSGDLDLATKLVAGQPLRAGLVIVDKNSGRLMATIDSAGRIVDIDLVPAAGFFITSIDTRRKDIEQSIDKALSKGQISTTEAQALRVELDRIAQSELRFRQANGTIPYEKALVIGYELNTLADKLVFPETHIVLGAPVISPRFALVGGQFVMVDSFTCNKLRLTQRVDDEYAAGRLSSQQVADLKQALNDISAQETRYRKNGELSEAKSRLLEAKLDKLQSRLEKDVAMINEKRSRIGIRVD